MRVVSYARNVSTVLMASTRMYVCLYMQKQLKTT